MHLFKRPKIDPLMSQPYSPTGKRFTRPIIYSDLKPPRTQKQIDEELDELVRRQARDHNREEIRKIVIALGLWIALSLMVWRLMHEHLAAAGKILLP
jgi:hypothetical protein